MELADSHLTEEEEEAMFKERSRTNRIERRQEIANTFSDLAYFMERLNPDDETIYISNYQLEFARWFSTKKEFSDAVKGLGGLREKSIDYSDNLNVTRRIGMGSFRFILSEPCPMVSTGEYEEVEVETIVTPAVVEKTTKLVPKMAKNCGSVLSDDEIADLTGE